MEQQNNLGQKAMPPSATAMASAIIWGSGQVINKQYLKGIFFFLAQCAVIITELLTGNYFVTNFNIRANGGFFLHGLWGFVTLGTEPRRMALAGLTAGDHSVVLMIKGIIAIFTSIFVIAIFIWNVRDAYKTRKSFLSSHEAVSSLEYVKKHWYSSFHYIMLVPALLLVLFFIVLPIIFSFLIAFTNYSQGNLPPVKLLDWVGFRNFVNIFKMPVWSFTFVRVLGWTLIWAALSTVSCYFGGMFQAIIINNKRVKLKKMWRGIFILPWAIPGMISLLVFKTMFNGQFGPISQFLLDTGITSERISWLSDPKNPTLAMAVIL